MSKAGDIVVDQDHLQNGAAAATVRDMIMGFRTTQLIYTAARLGIADLLKDGPRTRQLWRAPQAPIRRPFTGCCARWRALGS